MSSKDQSNKQVHNNDEIQFHNNDEMLKVGKAAYEQWGPIPDDVMANILEAEEHHKQVIAKQETINEIKKK